MQINETLILNTAIELAENIIDRYCDNNRLLVEKVDCSTGQMISKRVLIDELGDYVQYVYLLGHLTNRGEFKDWAMDQIINGIRLGQKNNGLIFTRRTSEQTRHPLIEYFSALDIGDTIWGLAEMFKITRDAQIKQIIDSFLDGLFRYCLMNHFVTYGCIPLGRLSFKVPLSNTMTTGYIAESLINIYKTSLDKSYLQRAQLLLSQWIDVDYFKKYGLFARVVPAKSARLLKPVINWQFVRRKRFNLYSTALVKGDTYLIFSLLSLYRITKNNHIKEAILRWRMAVKEKMVDESGMFFNCWDSRTNQKWSINLGENHSVIEALLDIYHDLEDNEALEMAYTCAKSWLKHQNALGLLLNNLSSELTFLDPQLDFSINLLKLSELTEEECFEKAAYDNLAALLTYHKLEYGFAQTVNFNTGEPQNGIIETKFLGLFIKGLLIFYNKLLNKNIFDDELSRQLASDR